MRLPPAAWKWLGAVLFGLVLGTALTYALPMLFDSYISLDLDTGRGTSSIRPQPNPPTPNDQGDAVNAQPPPFAHSPYATPPGPTGAEAREAADRHTLRGLLAADDVERPGFALYSYLLFDRASLDGINQLRRRAAILGFLTEVDPLDEQDRLRLQDSEVNAFYLPVRARPPADLARGQDALIDHLMTQYDFPRARLMIDRLRLTGDGPFIVAVMRPLSDPAGTDRDRMLVHDLSGVPPRLIPLWVREFRRQAARAEFWNRDLRQLALNARTAVTRLAEAFQATREAQHAIAAEPSH